jgi:ribosomal-protein-serine acetyltransferase
VATLIGNTPGVLRLSLSNGCHLRLLEESDVDQLYELIDTDRAYLSRWLPWAPDQTRQGTRDFIRGTRRQLADNNGFQMAIVRDRRIIGVVGFHAVDWTHRSTGIGYWLAEGEQGHGTMTTAVRALVDYAFSDWRLNRVEIRAASGNARSRAIPERLGFRPEGVLRQAELVGDRYVDHVVYAMLASEWRHADDESS